MVRRLLCLRWLDKPLRLTGAAKTAKAKLGGGPSLQSLLLVSHGSTRFTRGVKAMHVEMLGAL
jgi:hypothetical protein